MGCAKKARRECARGHWFPQLTVINLSMKILVFFVFSHKCSGRMSRKKSLCFDAVAMQKSSHPNRLFLHTFVDAKTSTKQNSRERS